MRDEVRARLRVAGFELVQLEAPIDPRSKVRPDVVAWAADNSGELVPWAVVEIKSGQFKTPELALPALARSRDLLGTTDHYAVVNGQWFKADRSVRSLEPVDGPTPPQHGPRGLLVDEGLATSLLLKSLWRHVDGERAHGAQVDNFFPAADLTAEPDVAGIETADGFVPVRSDVLWQARRRALIEFASNTGKGEALASDPVIARAMADLAGPPIAGTVLDPFCGTGSFLWAVMDRALRHDAPVEFVGVEVNDGLASLAGTIGRTAPLLTTIVSGDAFEVELPLADLVLAAPPLGMRLREPRVLLDGSTTTDMTVAAVDLALQQLRPGGRAVLHVAAGFTFQRAAEQYRQYLAEQLRVAALIGLPGGAVPGTGVRSVLLVIERREPGETFVAQLGEDWETQLASGGAALTAALAHIDGDRTGGGRGYH
ncbi:class I SAM-dependent DNA methyltransferase [Gordonia sp. VNK21]|uniref:HsdM family class I SAM-dependent methyltransferase n=1 Tax=Gordonia sp. VNK21 TaxID=3382483 RepID=UPI0038D5131C